MTTSSNLLWAALAIGAVTGMRSMLAPALVSRALSERDDLDGAGEAAQLLTSDSAQTFLPVLAAGEMLGDKMPFRPGPHHRSVDDVPCTFRWCECCGVGRCAA